MPVENWLARLRTLALIVFHSALLAIAGTMKYPSEHPVFMWGTLCATFVFIAIATWLIVKLWAWLDARLRAYMHRRGSRKRKID